MTHNIIVDIDRPGAIGHEYRPLRKHERPSPGSRAKSRAEARSKSAVNRYALKMSEVGAKIQQSREIADMWIARFGNQPQGKVGALLNELVRNLAFETALHLSEDEEPAHPGLLKDLAQAIEKLERASTINDKRQRDREGSARQGEQADQEAERDP